MIKYIKQYELLIDVQDRLYSDKEKDKNYRKILVLAKVLMTQTKINQLPRSIMFNHKYSLQSLVRSGEVRVS
tara:strand:- start:10380 stop:10595 length:216 start_codon:yes stop_codon:yes gene_type:complete